MDALGYIYGYEGLGLKNNNPIYDIKAAYPNLIKYYGLISGFAFSLSFSIAGIFAGIAIDKGKRIRILSLAVFLHSLA